MGKPYLEQRPPLNFLDKFSSEPRFDFSISCENESDKSHLLNMVALEVSAIYAFFLKESSREESFVRALQDNRVNYYPSSSNNLLPSENDIRLFQEKICACVYNRCFFCQEIRFYTTHAPEGYLEIALREIEKNQPFVFFGFDMIFPKNSSIEISTREFHEIHVKVDFISDVPCIII